jgi:hypothetical protein
MWAEAHHGIQVVQRHAELQLLVLLVEHLFDVDQRALARGQ